MANRAWSTQRYPCLDLSHTALSCDSCIAHRLARWFDNKANEAAVDTDDRLIYKACSDIMRASGTAKKLSATTGQWWALRVGILPSKLGRRLADVLHTAAGEHSRGWIAGTHQSQEDDQDHQGLRGLPQLVAGPHRTSAWSVHPYGRGHAVH